MIKLKRTFHAIGQGAFCSECFQNESGKEVFNIVYDCGTLSSKNYLFKAIDDFAKGRESIDVLFVITIYSNNIIR